jgi:signal transduction histidine kinase
MSQSATDGAQTTYKKTFFIKGLIVVALPLVVSSICLITLDRVWYLTDTIALQAKGRTVDIKLLDKAFGALITRGYKKFGYCFKNNRNVPIMPDLVPGANTGKESNNKQVNDIIISCQTLEVAVDQEARAMLDQVFHSNAERLKSYLHIIEATIKVDQKIEQLILQDQTTSDAIWTDWDRTRTTINIITAIAFVTATGVAILLTSYFSYDLLQRIQELASRTRRLSSFRRWSKKSQHIDEIALIDHTLQAVAERLASAEAERAVITRIVSQNILKPAAQCKSFATTSATTAPIDISQWTAVIEQAYAKMDQFASALTATGHKAGRSKTLDRTYLALYDRAQSQLNLLAPIASKKSITLQNNCHPISILADCEAFDRVIANLVSNAIKFAPTNSTVTIANKTNVDGAIAISVFDQGPGLQNNQKDLFERFAQQDSEQKAQGFGVGLAICRELVQAHGGEIGYRPVQPKGTEFWFTLPQSNALMDSPEVVQKEQARVTEHIYQSSLFKQSLIVMLLPLIMQVLGLAWIHQRIQSDFELLKQVRRQEQLALTTSRMWLNIFDGCYSTALYLVMQQGSYETRARQKLKTIRTLLPQLTPQAMDMPDQVAALKALMVASEYEAKTAEQSLDTMGIFEAQDILSSLAYSLDRASLLTAKISHTLDLQFNQIASLVQTRQKQQQADQSILNLILLTNFIAAMALTILFARTMNARVKALVQATEDILKEKPIKPPEHIKDELDQLLVTLSTESARLSQTKIARENLLASIAHDLRSPLQSIKLALHSIDQALLKALNTKANGTLASDSTSGEGASQSISDKNILTATQQQIQTLSNQINISEDLINDLLTLNKLQQNKTTQTDSVNLSECSVQAIEELADLAGEKSIFVDLEIENNDCVISGNWEQVTQLIKRLIKLSIINSTFDSSVVVTVTGQAKQLITIKDTGPALGQRHKAPYVASADSDTESLQQTMSLALCEQLSQANNLQLTLSQSDNNTLILSENDSNS